METLDIGYGPFDCGYLLRRERVPCCAKLLFRHCKIIETHTVEAFRVGAQGRIAPLSDRIDDLERDSRNVGARLLCRPVQHGVAIGIGQLVPLEDAHGPAHASIFSTGSTRSALAPAFFRLSSVSQNTFSRHTACTATLSGWPSRGMMVGDSLPGSSRRISPRAAR